MAALAPEAPGLRPRVTASYAMKAEASRLFALHD